MMRAALQPAAGARFRGGVHPPRHKELAAGVAIEVVPTPTQVSLALLQHAGAPATAVVKMRQRVLFGETVAESEAPVGATVHASIAGTVARQTVATLANGRHVAVLPIKADGDQLEGPALYDELLGGSWPLSGLDAYAPEKIVTAAREGGLVGMGGAAFPTHVKLAPATGRRVETVVVNGCECEPYLTADQQLMEEAPRAVLAGALLAARAVGARHLQVAVEDDKPAALAALAAAADGTGIEVRAVPTRYPQGAERMLVPVLLGREVPATGLPLDVGALVINVGTTAALAAAVLRRRPLTHRVVTVTGAGVARPGNLLAPLGIPLSDLLAAAGGLRPGASRVIAGGPMMGFTVGDLSTPLTKGTSGLTVLTADDLHRARETACIRCGRCVDVCPLHLVPTRLALASRRGAWELARRYDIQTCMECGCCAYSCPAQIPLVQLIRMGKARLAAAA